MKITERLEIPDEELEFTAVRSRGAGGQHVNKTNSAACLRFDILASSLPEDCKTRLLASSDHRISSDGVVVIKAQSRRGLERNRIDAIERLAELIRVAMSPPVPRRPTQPPVSSKRKRMDTKRRRGQIKATRKTSPREIDDQ